ncbi:uncharacterized protein AC631_01613 [Debaryomyces fabryi]|uniref:Uncharacterized protein n=1 Tax=Debaryomyces fabryi TaxID=58627 RepID=A0A0V1Q2F3_9ASCO|nr:uncharacterized protein AC631_01613 [Debaryomyces fabryi]KSA02626.1 hypothetical protein AC631_01613 [Debaryomyces fabryi]CUM45736.1 unnamed protein product [Debaryomyces fabryi]
MSNDFLQSSPSRHMIDPAIYNTFPDIQEDRNSSNSNNGSTLHHQQQHQSQQLPVGPPSAQKNHNQLPSNLTGWTPLISKTIFNDQLISYNSTPSGKFFNGVLSGHVNNEIDYAQGLNLTPFLTHNLNIPNSNSHINGISNITPFHDKTLHLTDFFMDSPIKQTPIKNIDTITPSKFKIGSERKYVKQSVFQDPKSALKRSITQIDTPPRQPHKLSILNKHEARYEKTNTIDGKVKAKDEEEDEENEDEENEKKGSDISVQNKNKLYGLNLQTPSKTVLKDISNINQNQGKSTPMPRNLKKSKEFFETPSKQFPDSSPSTVIMSSAAKSSPSKPVKTSDMDSGKHVTVKYSTTQNLPPSPTPKKDIPKITDNADVLKPAMGVFSEKKSKPPLKSKQAVFKNLSGDSTGTSTINTKTKNSSKAQMQAGMNKFQIVFTDVHTLMNKKNKLKKSNNVASKPKLKRSQSTNRSNDEQPHTIDNGNSRSLTRSSTAPVTNHQSYQTAHKMVSSNDHNVSMNTSSKEVSLISGNSNSMNTSNLNMSSTDHSSFELGGLSSTPNGKYFLDKMFDKPSPQSQQNLNTNQYYSLHQSSFSNMPPPNPNTSRPPPTVAQHNLLHAQQQQQHPMMMMMMMMSTPQHQNVVNYGPNVYNSANEISPTSDNQFTPNPNVSSFSYQQYTKSGKPSHNTMGPMMVNLKESSQFSQLIPVSTSDEDEDVLLKREEDSV